ncbi:MAG: lipid-A-disaccharide synthase [Candidatus Omnitrophota bacterium]
MDKQVKKNIIIIAGEASADMHGAELVKRLKTLSPGLRIYGIGGNKLREAGVQVFADLTPYALIGFFEVLKHLSIFKNIFRLTLRKIRQIEPCAVILLDLPGFNLKMASAIKAKFPGIKIIYYISPQIWAWGQNRINIIRNSVDKMLVFFEFEKYFYEKHNIDVDFVGHPLLETVKPTKEKEQILNELSLKKEDKIIGLLPGSRMMEIARILPLMLKGAEQLNKKVRGIKFILFRAPGINEVIFERIMKNFPGLAIITITGNNYDFLNVCSFAWVCSGTATLETALMEVPMLVVYKTSFVTWLISKSLIRLPYIGLVNVVAQEKIVPEFIQYQATDKNICRYTADFLLRPEEEQNILRKKLKTLKKSLGEDNASQNAARIIAQYLSD